MISFTLAFANASFAAGRGPQLRCDKCSRTFFGGERFQSGAMNWCHECLVDSLGTTTESEFHRLGRTQQGFFGLASQLAEMRGLTGNELKSFLLTTLKRNAGEMDADASDSTSFSLPSNLTVKPIGHKLR